MGGRVASPCSSYGTSRAGRSLPNRQAEAVATTVQCVAAASPGHWLAVSCQLRSKASCSQPASDPDCVRCSHALHRDCSGFGLPVGQAAASPARTVAGAPQTPSQGRSGTTASVDRGCEPTARVPHSCTYLRSYRDCRLFSGHVRWLGRLILAFRCAWQVHRTTWG